MDQGHPTGVSLRISPISQDHPVPEHEETGQWPTGRAGVR